MTQQPDGQNGDGGQQPPRFGAPQPPQYGQPHPGGYRQPAGPYGQPGYEGSLYPPFVPRPRVGFVEAIRLGFSNYANFKGRAGRSEYWWWFLFRTIVVGVFYAPGAVLFFSAFFSHARTTVRDSYGMHSVSSSAPFSPEMGIGVLLMVIAGIIVLGLLLPDLAVTWRRLHDAGFPGPMFFLVLIPTIGGIILVVLNALPSKPEGMKYEYL